jgi:N utilization substance protein A
MTPEQLEAIEGIGPKTVEKISVAVNNYFAGLEGGEAVALPENEGEAVSEPEASAVEEIAAPEGDAAAVEAAEEQAEPGPGAEAQESVAPEAAEATDAPEEQKE